MLVEYLETTKSLKYENLRLPDRFPFPYKHESFTEDEIQVLNQYFTNTNSPVFAIYNLPQEVVGAMFSRYSRTDKSVRRVFLDEFWASKELGIKNVREFLQEENGLEKQAAQKRAENFYKRVFAQYGDDSVIQMGSVHIAFECVSQIAAKAIEDQRIGAGYIEKSTRYVDFGTTVNDHYLFMEVPEIMQSEFADEYLEWNKELFDAYNKHFPITLEMFRKKYPLEEQVVFSPKLDKEISFGEITDEDDKMKVQKAYERALKAKTFDTIRVFLPTTTVTNLGAHFSGQTAEHTINKMIASPSSEVRLLGTMGFLELSKVVPSFLQNIDNHHGETARNYLLEASIRHQEGVSEALDCIVPGDDYTVKLVDWDNDLDVKVASQLIYTGQKDKGLDKAAIFSWTEQIKREDLVNFPGLSYSPRLTKLVKDSIPDRKTNNRNRRHKLPRAFEHAFCEVEYHTDFGIYRDLQRNRISSTERQMLTAEEAVIPGDFYENGMEEVLADYQRLTFKTKQLNHKIKEKSNPDLLNASEYVTILGNKMRYNVRANIRQWSFFTELRTIDGGHPSYRLAMQEAVRQILEVYPFARPYFAHVDWVTDYGLGRLKAEVKTQEKLSKLEF